MSAVIRVDPDVRKAIARCAAVIEERTGEACSTNDALRELCGLPSIEHSGRRQVVRCIDGYTRHRWAFGDKCVRCGAPKIGSTKAREEARGKA